MVDRFVAKFCRRLRQWWIALGPYRQLQVKQSLNVDALIAIIYSEFLGSWDHYATQVREEFLSMRLCSFKRISRNTLWENVKEFYAFNDIDDVNLKQTFKFITRASWEWNIKTTPIEEHCIEQCFAVWNIPNFTCNIGKIMQSTKVPQNNREDWKNP